MKNPDVAPAVGRQALAGFLDVSPRHISRLTTGGVLVRDETGEYPLAANIQCFVRYAVEAERRRTQETAGDRLKETRRLEVERNMARDDRKIISLDESLDALDSVVGLFVEALGALPRRATQDREIADRLTTICDEIRTELSAKLEKSAYKLRTGKESKSEG